MGREKELSIHFVPGNCRLVEVRESARVLGRGGEVRIVGTECAEGTSLAAGAGVVFQTPPAEVGGPGRRGRRRRVCLLRCTPFCVFFFSRCDGKRVGRVSVSTLLSPLSGTERGFQSCFSFDYF